MLYELNYKRFSGNIFVNISIIIRKYLICCTVELNLCKLKFHFFLDEKESYYKAPKGENCPRGKVTETEDRCAKASSLMGYPFLGVISSTDRPAGCFWDKDENCYFNVVVETRLTRLDGLNSVGGICKWKGNTQ